MASPCLPASLAEWDGYEQEQASLTITTLHGRDSASPMQPASLDRLLSERIELLRIALIIGIMIIHIPYDMEHNPYEKGRAAFEWLILYLREGFFRAGVPCLSVISGWLLARQADRGYPALVKKKFRTLMVPYLCFNLLTFCAVLAMQVAGAGTYWEPIDEADTSELLNMLFGLSAPPINIALYFLRDMMACVLLAPILFWGARNAPMAVLVPILLFSLAGPRALMPDGVQEYFLFIIRPDILLFFYIGIVVRIRGLDATAFDRYLGPALAIGILGGAVSALIVELEVSTPVRQALLLSTKAAISLSVWIISSRLVRSGIGKWLARNGHKAFWLFCTHVPFLTLLFMLWGRTGWPYELYYLLVVPVAVTILLLIHRALRQRTPQLLSAILGSRSLPRQKSAAMAGS